MVANLTTFNDMLKEYYAGPKPELLAYKDHPLLAMMPKSETWGGQENKYIIPLHVRAAQAVANDFATALANKGEGLYDRFEMGRKKKYGFAQLDRLALLASMQDPKAFLKLYTTEVNGVMEQMGADIAWNLYRNSHGARGRIAGTTGAFTNVAEAAGDTTITLRDRSEIVGFEVGMKVVFSLGSAAPGVTAVHSFAAYTISAVDRSAGTLFFDGATLNTTSGVQNADWIHRQGDIVTAGTFIGIEGLDDHIPEAAPTSTLFQGVNRSVDTDRLGGLRISASSSSITDALVDGGMRLKEAGKAPDRIFMNPVRGGQLIKELGSNIVHDKVKAPGKASLGFDAIKVYTPAGTLPVVFDADCPQDVIWVLKMSTWKLASVKKMPHIADDDVTMLRSATADEYEVRLAAYGNLGCHDPGANLRIDLD